MTPRRSQKRPKRPQDDPKSAPRAARSAPRGAQEQPGAHQKGPKRAPGRPRPAKKPPGALREAPGVHFGIILGGSGLHFQAIEASFSKLARAPPDNRKTLFEMTGQKVLCWVGRRLGAENATTTREFTLSPAKTAEFTDPTGFPGVFSHVGPQQPSLFTWFRAFHAFLRPLVAPRG